MLGWSRVNLGLVMVLSGILALLAWGAPDPYSEWGLVLWRGFQWALIGLFLAAAAGLWMAVGRKEKLPDLLAEVSAKYFERKGVCFVPRLTVIDGVCWMEVFFQNRFSGRCECAVTLRPGRWTTDFGSEGVATVEVYFECPGAAFGVARIPYAVPTEYQGESLLLKVGAQRRYPDGPGELLRYRDGIRVGKSAKGSGLTPFLMFLLFFTFYMYNPPSIAVVFPKGVAIEVEEWEPEVQILSDPLGGGSVL